MQGVSGNVRFITTFQALLALLLTVASIVTPLGLYETIVPQKQLLEEPFSYMRDTSSIGIGYVIFSHRNLAANMLQHASKTE